jgi:DNA-binding response OmpR family regulator
MPIERAGGRVDRRRALVVESDPIEREMLCFLFERNGWRPIGVASYARALMVLVDDSVDLLVVNPDLPGGDGTAFCTIARQRSTGLIITVADASEGKTAAAELAAGADDHLAKPWDAAEFLARLNALQRRRAWQRNGSPDDAVEGVNGERRR